MRIGILGSGNVGGALGTRWAQNGHNVVFGTRDPGAKDVQDLVKRAGKTSKAATLADAAETSETLLLATPAQASKEVLEKLGDLKGKILIDATNALLPDLSGLTYNNTTSGAEQVASWARNAKVVKAFNTVGSNIMANASFGAERPVMFFCGDDSSAKQTVKQLADELGFEPIDAGPLTQARVLEPFALLWISLALKTPLGREIAFKLVRR